MLRSSLLSLLLFFLSLTACTPQPKPTHPDVVRWLQGLSVEQVNELKLASEPATEYVKMTDYALRLAVDTANDDNRLKGQLLLEVISAHLRSEFEQQRLSHTSDVARGLIATYAANDFQIYQGKTPDAVKLAIRLCEGNYGYIYSRLHEEWYYRWLLAGVAGMLGLYVASFFAWFRWRHRRVLNRTLTVGLVVLVVLAIAFKATCAQYITSSSVYGIRF